MPLANFKAIKEVTSEDSNHKASNLLKMMPGKKWKTKNLGEKSAHVIFELYQEHLITGIDIGNEYSAFVEVLVANNCNSGEDFKEILITSSFMTPTESRNCSHINRVRCFSQNDLVDIIASKKWSLIKVLCTQPFNKHVQYGLCFIKIHVEDSNMVLKDATEKCLSKYASQNLKNVEPILQNIGRFTLREDSPESDPDTSKLLFGRWKMSHKEVKLPETVKTASKQLTRLRHDQIDMSYNTMGKAATPSDKSKVIHEEVRDRNRYELLFCEDDTHNRRLEKHIFADSKDSLLDMEKSKKRRSMKSVEVQPQETSDTNKYDSNILKPSEILNEYTNDENPFSANKRAIKRIKPDTTVKCVAFEKLLPDVVLVISGIQNPDRAELRRKALAMGARYKADWDNSCTHLICAFKNTPKYNQVKGKGKIVTRIWIEQCFSLKKRLPWRRYAVDSTEASHPESEEEVFAESTEYCPTESKSSKHSVKQKESSKNCEKAMYDFDNKTSESEDNLENCKNFVSFENKSGTSIIDVYDETTEEEEYLQYRIKHCKK